MESHSAADSPADPEATAATEAAAATEATAATEAVAATEATAATGATAATEAGAPGTEAVPYDPFADEPGNDTDYEVGTAAIAALLDDLGALHGHTGSSARGGGAGERSHKAALEKFRELKGLSRSDRLVAEGMVQLPFVQLTDPLDALINPHAPEHNHLPAPTLHAGDVVAEQYEIAGVIAHGGLGWVYLAQDRNVSGRWVVLKGLMDEARSQDRVVAEAEREFLADITHPGIVKIFNFIDTPAAEGGFIVMEYVGGPSLKDRRKNQPGGVLPVDVAIGYMLEVLDALEYLHSRGVVYNDLKPDNIIVTEDQVKLIDLGAVTGIGAFGYIYGTRGFQAPEVATEGPSIESDIFTVGRTLAALTVKLPVDGDAYAPGLPSPNHEDLFRHHLSFYRLLLRATDPDPSKRFHSVPDLADQLYGVLREILAVRDGRQYPAQHSRFSPQRTTFGTKHTVFRTDQLIDGIERQVRITPPEVVAALPVPLIDRRDPGAALISGSSYAEPSEALETLRQAMRTERFPDSREIPLGIVRTLLDLGLTMQAQTWLRTLTDTMGEDWRHQWYSGITALLLEDLPSAQQHFTKVLQILPGEAAPKLALAAVDEIMLQDQGHAGLPVVGHRAASAAASLESDASQLPQEVLQAMGSTWSHITHNPHALRFHSLRMYSLVWTTNPTTVSSAFGLARNLMAEGLMEEAVAALDKLPQASRHHRMAKLTTILYLVSGEPEDLTEARIRRAARRLEEIPTNEPRLLQITIAIMSAALNWLRAHDLDHAASDGDLLNYPFTQRGLRLGLAGSLRKIARRTPFARHRYELVDMANAVRPETWF